MKIVVGVTLTTLLLLTALFVARCSLPESKSSRDGQGGLFWLVWLLDKTVGLPESPEKFPDHAATARAFLDRFDAAELDAARAMMSKACRERLSLEALRESRTKLGSAHPAEGRRRWKTLRHTSGPHTEVGARATFVYPGSYETGSARLTVVVLRAADGLHVDEFAVRRR